MRYIVVDSHTGEFLGEWAEACYALSAIYIFQDCGRITYGYDRQTGQTF